MIKVYYGDEFMFTCKTFEEAKNIVENIERLEKLVGNYKKGKWKIVKNEITQ